MTGRKAIVIAAILGCSAETPSGIVERAIELCTLNDGLEYIFAEDGPFNLAPYWRAKCNNGALFGVQEQEIWEKVEFEIDVHQARIETESLDSEKQSEDIIAIRDGIRWLHTELEDCQAKVVYLENCDCSGAEYVKPEAQEHE